MGREVGNEEMTVTNSGCLAAPTKLQLGPEPLLHGMAYAAASYTDRASDTVL